MSDLVNKMYLKALIAKNSFIDSLKDEDGETNLVAIILILAVVIALVVIFRGEIEKILDKIWAAIGGDVDAALK